MNEFIRGRINVIAVLKAGVFGFVFALAGCSLAPTVSEPLRVGNVTDLSPETGGFQRGVTTLEQARAAFQMQGLTGVAEHEYAGGTGPTLAVLAADYQSRVHVFRGGYYDQSITLPTRGIPPYGMAVRLGWDGTSHVLLVLYRDPLARAEEPPTLLSFQPSGGQFVLTGRATFETLVSKHGGMTRPMLLGDDFSDGVLLVARDRDGELWDTSYLVQLTRPDPRGVRTIALAPKSMTEAMRCSCVRNYAMGY
ncbi:MAG: hypothetical protein HOW73_05455 [Polyangiaceae bacterium]|nr:hypothetical protein [Polyangiaceae bacterium]